MSEHLFAKAARVMSRRSLVRLRVVGALFVVGGFLVMAGQTDGAIIVGGGFMIAGVIYGLVLPRLILARAVKRSRPALVGPWRYEFAEHGLKIVTPLAATEIPWQSFVRVTDHPEFWLLHTTIKSSAIIVVKAAFSDADQATIAEQLPRLVGASSNSNPPAPSIAK